MASTSLRRLLKQPGSWRILLGGSLVLILAVATAAGRMLTDWDHEEMDLENLMSPPEVGWLRGLLTTEEGLRLHERNRSGGRGRVPGPTRESPEDDDELDFLRPSGAGEGGSAGPEAAKRLQAASDGPQGAVGGVGEVAGASESAPSGSPQGGLARLQDEDEELDMLEGLPASGSGPGAPTAEDSGAAPREISRPGGDAAEPTAASAGSGNGEAVDGAGPEAEAGAGPGEAAAARRPHYLGTDRNGRDLLALLVAGARTCFVPGLVTCAVALGLGIPLGLLAGYYGGRFRKVVGTLNGTVLSLPRLVLILVVICALEPNVYYTMAVLGATLVPRVSELIATRVRILSNMGFILAAKEAALSDFKILYRHLFWYQNRAVFFIQFSLIMAESILVETTLSYLQFGTKPPEVSWGNIIEGSQMSFFSGFYWITFFPAGAIILAILGFFYLGDGLNARLAWREGR